jgi:hypothetical protein
VDARWPKSESRIRPVLLDEGGVRYENDGVCRYLAFALLQGAMLVDPLFGRYRLALQAHTGEWHTMPLPSGVDGPLLVAEIERRRNAALTTKRLAEERRGDLGAWIARLRASGRSGIGYRASAIDVPSLERTFGDVTEENEARAAAAHALLARHVRGLVTQRTGRFSPPLVVAAVRLSPYGHMIVGDGLLGEVLPFLELRDRVVIEQRLRAA